MTNSRSLSKGPELTAVVERVIDIRRKSWTQQHLRAFVDQQLTALNTHQRQPEEMPRPQDLPERNDAWVPTDAVCLTPDRQWGEFSRRQGSFDEILEALAVANSGERSVLETLRVFYYGRNGNEPIEVSGLQAACSPSYRVWSGSHRTHAARVLDIPYLLANIT